MELRVPTNSHPSWKEELLQFYKKGTRVWLTNSEETWDEGVIATEFCANQIVVKNIATDELVNVSVKQCLPSLMNPPFQDGIDDLTRLTHLNEPGVLGNLNFRFTEMRNIYTYCGIVLIAVNPFESTGHLYGDEVIKTYHSFGKDVRQADPHIYAVSQEAFFDLKEFKKNQVIIVSGESGAGKTVNAKYSMRFFATVATKSKRFDDIEARLLSTNVLLEALGNAKTSRNDNSSRFGKFVQINFDDVLAIASAEVKTYLLEKSRLVHQSPGERNYHIFYQMCKSREHDLLRPFELDRSENYHYLNQGGDARIPGVDDREEFNDLLGSLSAMGVSSSLVQEMFGTLIAILTLGNVDFVGQGDTASITEKGSSSLHRFCELLGIDNYNKVTEMLVSKKLRVAGQEIRKDFTKVEADRNRDAFAKLLYQRLFNYMVAAANDAIAGNYVERGKKHFVGVLDIYGFETFDINSFEQFCINYANEKLQQHFCTHIFKLEQEEYEREGINWSRIEFSDNQETIDLIESRMGLITLMDEQCKIVNGSDESFLLQTKSNIKNGKLEFPKTKRDQFSVKHFASDVAYTVHGFLEKNKDEVSADFVDLVATSVQKIPLVKLILDKDYSQTGPVGTQKGKKTVAGSFYLSLQELMKTLNTARPHYVRCVKPNDYKESFCYQGNRVLPQLRACGVLETVRISAAGYPSRLSYDRFITRYRCIVTDWWIRYPRKSKPQLVAQAMCIAETIELHEQIACGKTQVFMKTGHIARFEDARSTILNNAATTIQARWKGFLAQRRYVTYRNNVRIIQATCRAYMAYRHLKFLQMHRAAVLLQANIRGYLEKKKYLELKAAVLAVQSAYRAKLVRDEIRRIKYEKSVLTIQRYWRGYLVRREEINRKKKIVRVQACVRRWLAKRRLRELKIEARSVNHLQSANRGLENKIIMLQFRLDAAQAEKKELSALTVSQKESIALLENDRVALKEARKRIEQLEVETERLATEVDVKEGEIGTLSNKLVAVESEKEKVLADSALAKCLASSELSREIQARQELEAKLTEVQKLHEKEEKARKAVELEIQKMRDQLLANANLLANPTLTKSSAPRRREEPPPGEITDITLIVRQQAMISDLRKKWEEALQKLRRTELLNETVRLLDNLNTDSALESYDQETVLSVDSYSSRNSMSRRSIIHRDPFEDENVDVEYLAKELSMARDEIAGLRALLVRYNQENRSSGGSPRPDSGAGSEVETDTDRLPDISTQLCLLRTIKQLKNLLWATGKELYKLHADQRQLEYADIQQPSDVGVNSRDSLEQRVQKLASENMDLTQKVLAQNENLREAYEKLREHASGSEPSGSEQSQKVDTTLVVPHSARLKVWDLPELTRILVFDLKPRVARIITKNFPAYLLLTACRYFDRDEGRVGELCQSFYTMVKDRIAGSTDLDILSMWLVNTWSFLNLLRQYGGYGAVWPADWNKQNTELQGGQRIGCDVSSQLEQIRHLVEETYRVLMKTAVQPILEPKIVPGVLQHESTDGLGPRRKSIDGKDTKKYLSDLLDFMTFIHAKLSVYGADQELLRHVFRQMSNWIASLALNQLMFRKDLCTFEKAIQIKHNVMEVQNWLAQKSFNDLRSCLDPLVQACHLLQSRKDESNLDTICGEMTDLLKPRQVVAILQHYTPGQDFEERNIDPKFLVTVQKRLVEREVQLHGSDKEKDALILAGTFVAPIGEVPFTYSDFQLEMLTLPSALYLTHVCQMLPKED